MELRNDLIVIDVETTGPNPFSHDLLSVALVPVTVDVAPLIVHVRSENLRWSEFGRANFQKFDRDWSTSSVSPPEALARIEQYIETVVPTGSATLVGHNVGFDTAFLRKLAFLCGKDDVGGVSHRSIDTHSLLYFGWLQGKVPEKALTSDGAFETLGITAIRRSRHTALGDALATRLLFLRLLALLDDSSSQSLLKVR